MTKLLSCAYQETKGRCRKVPTWQLPDRYYCDAHVPLGRYVVARAHLSRVLADRIMAAAREALP